MLRPLYKGKRSGQNLNDYYRRLNICKFLEAPVPAKPKCLETKETVNLRVKRFTVALSVNFLLVLAHWTGRAELASLQLTKPYN